MTEYGMRYTILPTAPPLDFSQHRSTPEARDLPCSSVLDLRVKKFAQENDHNIRSMLEACGRRTDTPPVKRKRVESETTVDSCPRTSTPVTPLQISRQNTTTGHHLPCVDALLYVNTSDHDKKSISTYSDRQFSPSNRQELPVVPDTTAPISGQTFHGNRNSGPTEYHSAFHSLISRDRGSSAQPKIPAYLDPSAYDRLLSGSGLSLDRISGKQDPPPISGKTQSFLPLSVLSSDWMGGKAEFPVGTGSDNRTEEPTSSFDFSRVRDADGSGSGSGSDGEQVPVSSGSGKDELYWERRRKNNEAAKKSRDARRAKEDEIALKAAVLEKENICLKLNLAALKKEHQRLLHALT